MVSLLRAAARLVLLLYPHMAGGWWWCWCARRARGVRAACAPCVGAAGVRLGGGCVAAAALGGGWAVVLVLHQGRSVRVGRGIAEALLYSRNEAIIITEFLRRFFGDAYSKPRSRGKTKPFTVRTSLPPLVQYSSLYTKQSRRTYTTPHIHIRMPHHRSTRSSLKSSFLYIGKSYLYET